MRKRTRIILEELNSLHVTKHGDEFLQSTGMNIIESAINLLDKLQQTYDEKTALELERRFINSIRTGNSKKYKTGIDKIIESKK